MWPRKVYNALSPRPSDADEQAQDNMSLIEHIMLAEVMSKS